MLKKVFKKRHKKELPARITNDTVAEHRERILAGGRKLKYPVQYTRSALVRNALIISVGGLLAIVGLVWVQLYVVKDTSDLAYRITSVIPLPVANIDGESVPYSEYLMHYRASLAHTENQNKNTRDLPKDKLKFQQEMALEKAMKDAYARKIARQMDITVSDDRASQLIDSARKDTGLSERAFEAATWDNLHWTIDEMRLALKNDLIRQEVSFAVDDQATKKLAEAEKLIASGQGLKEVAESMGDAVEFVPEITVPSDNADGGLSSAVEKLKIDQVSKPIKTSASDGYYIALRHQSEGDMVAFSYIKIPLTKFNKDFAASLKSNKTSEYINIKKEG